jgi:hypothetical protein
MEIAQVVEGDEEKREYIKTQRPHITNRPARIASWNCRRIIFSSDK